LGPDYFDACFSCSGSVFADIFCAANQPEDMLDIWRNFACDGQLVSVWKLFRGRKVLDLDYMIELCASRLNHKSFANSKTVLKCVMTDYHRGTSVYGQLTPENLWTLARATSAVPCLHGPVETDFGLMIDGGLSDPFPIQQALNEGYDEVVAVYNKPSSYVCHPNEDLACTVAAWFLPPQLAYLLRTFEERRLATEKLFSDPRVKLIQAKSVPLRTMWDGNKLRLNAFIDCGVEDVRTYVSQLAL
jgi:predicted patatin/cPLA2 family phospholipase